ncbi:MAG: PAS domain-containing protein [Deltaproteobacteria bacterium]|nr:PAS domain-containing protein [Deltaproteobacteria bacterium]
MGHEEKIPRIFNSISLPLLLINRDFVVVAANSAAIPHLSQSQADVIGESCFKVTHDADEPCWHSEETACPVKEAFETGRRARAIHKHRIKGHIIVEEIVATPFVEDTPQIDYVIEEYRDVTELLDLRDGILPVCLSCKKIRDTGGSWHPIEEYIGSHTGADFSHSLCPDCFQRLYPE